jgi:hypothetical protein
MGRRKVVVDLAKHRMARETACRPPRKAVALRGDGYRRLIGYALARFQTMSSQKERKMKAQAERNRQVAMLIHA